MYEKDVDCLCKKHAMKHSELLMPAKEYSAAYLKSMKKEALLELFQYCFSETPPPKTKPEIVMTIHDYYETKLLKKIIVETQNANKVSLLWIARKINECFQNMVLETIDCIIIENQISVNAIRMKTIQGMLMQYFVTKRPDIQIECISSSNKLRDFSCQKFPEKSRQQENKINSEIICREIFVKNPDLFGNWQHVLEENQYTDDLTDCFLQGIYYMKKQGWICQESESFAISVANRENLPK